MATNLNCCYSHPITNTVNCLSSTFNDGTPYFEDVEELRTYILDREANRKLSDLINVADNLDSFAEGTLIAYNATTQVWDVIDTLLPIIW